MAAPGGSFLDKRDVPRLASQTGETDVQSMNLKKRRFFLERSVHVSQNADGPFENPVWIGFVDNICETALPE